MNKPLLNLALILSLIAVPARGAHEETQVVEQKVAEAGRPEDMALSGNALIDKHMTATWSKHGLTPSGKEENLIWMRRAYLDILGRIPTQEEVSQFVASKGDRAGLCDKLVEQPDFSKYLAFLWTAAMTGTNPDDDFFNDFYGQRIREDLERQFARGDSWKQIAPAAITSRNFQSANNGENREAETEIATRALLGLRVECAKCHNQPDLTGGLPLPTNVSHPKMMSQKEYVALNALFNRRTGMVTGATRSGEVFSVRPGFSGKTGSIGDIFTEHEAFPKAFVNRTIGVMFGRGLNSADVDDFRVDDRVNHPELLRDLSAKFAADGYRPKELYKWICKSNAYNLSSKTNESNAKDEHYFSHGPTKRMTTYQLGHSLAVAFGEPQRSNDWLQFVRSQGWEDSHGRQINADINIPSILSLMNSDRVSGAIKTAPILKASADPATQIKLMFMNTLGRIPDAAETQKFLSFVKQSKDMETGMQDMLWALLNSNEFVINH